MRVESIHGVGGVLSVRCSGIVGIGSESTASMRPVGDAVADWLRGHQDHSVREIVVDFRDVDYRWGDAPVSCLVPFLGQGVQRIRLLAGSSNAQALEGLVVATNMPWFTVERVDA